VADNADMAAERQEIVDDLLLQRRPRPPQRQAPGSDCLGCGDPIPEERLAVLPNCCLCVGCQEDAERVLGR
jgi:RNA polymerase-binding transcription factor DksA